jgi:type VI secretion system protein VasG
MDINLKALIGKLNDASRRSLENAAGICQSRSNYNVEIEHWMLKIVEMTNTDVARLLRYYEVDVSRLNRDLMKAIDKLKTGNGGSPSLSLRIIDLIRDAWMVASIDHGERAVRTGHLLYALLASPDLSRQARESMPELKSISPDQMSREMRDIIAGSIEDEPVSPDQPSGAQGGGAAGPTGGPASKTPALDQFTVDLTLKARQGKIDPVLGRDFEIRQVVDILTRRRQNNPILTGEAGVGKTAVVEGFALRIAAGDVPPPLKNVSLRTLDLALLQAGAGVKGEFENRLKSVIEEVKASSQPIILFIDEAHTLIGAGGTAGQGDAANLLKPALARGELRTIAATTWSEYKKYFEKDAALARRFQVVKVEEPSEEQAIIMMRGLVATLEKHHNLRILDEAIEEAVRLSHRYITGRQLPDKAVSLLDTACARVAIGHSSTPGLIEDLQRQVDHLGVQIGILTRESATGDGFAEKIAELTEQKTNAEKKLAESQERWKKESELVLKIRGIREQLESHVMGGVVKKDGPAGDSTAKQAAAAAAPEQPKLDDAGVKKLREELSGLEKELRTLQGEQPLMQVCVDGQTIAEVVSAWTGIPVGKMLTDEIKTVLALREKMEERIIGQSHALEIISQRIRTARANLVDPRRPIGVFLLVGPSGVGKTETALTLADLLYGGERNMVIINMSEYQESHTVSGLKGSPPGYVGYGEGGVLTEAVRRRPYSVVLLDEIEKAHQDVQELFYQVFDKGMLEDSEGREIDFKNTIILCTSNVGTDTFMKLCADPDTKPEPDALAEAIRPDLLKSFKPAFLGRMSVVPYYPLADDIIKRIIRLQLGKIATRMQDNHRTTLEYDDALVNAVAGRCREVESGARNVDHILTRNLLPEVSREFLTRLAEGREISRVRIGVNDAGAFQYEIT